MVQRKITRSISLLLVLCMVVSVFPLQITALDTQIGDTVTTPTNQPPAPIENAVWVLTDSIECKKIAHTHTVSCYYQTCDHANGHLSTCYSQSTAYSLCQHEDAMQHTGAVTLSDVVTINGSNVSWKTNHPAYTAVYAVYKAAYDEAYANTKISFLKESAAKAAGIAALIGKTFCYTTSTNASPDRCQHGECSELGGACYTKICIIPEHIHDEACYQYTWTLKSDINKNGIADDTDTYYTIQYINDGKTIYKESVLVGMPTPTITNPYKTADTQYTYEFIGWNEPVADTVTDNAVYTAVYKNITNKYTVTWVDENDTELEVDTGVEYGEMPTYDGELPTKEGDSTVKYTFAGWTPAIESVTGDVQYKATYTTQNIFEVQFVIDGELQKTEYVLEGDQVEQYAPTRPHYALSVWQNEASAYQFSQPVTSNLVLEASWELIETFVSVDVPHATWTSDGIYPVNTPVSVNITPEKGYAISKVMLNGVPVAVSYDNNVVTVEFVTDETTEAYLIEAQSQKVNIQLNAAEMNVFGDLSSTAIFNAIYDTTHSFPILTPEDVTIEYLAFSIEFVGKTYEWWVAPGANVSITAFLDQYNLGKFASYIPTELLPHQFGTESVEQVRVSFTGNDMYPAATAQTTVVMVDMRIPTQVHLNSKVNVVYGVTEDEILRAAFKSVTAGDTTVTTDYRDTNLVIAGLNAGTYTATVSFAGTKDYAPAIAEIEVVIQKASGSVSVQSVTGKFGTDIYVADMIESNANCIQIVMGMYLGDNASKDSGALIQIALPQLIDLNSIHNPTVKATAEQFISYINNSLNKQMTIEELRKTLDATLPYIEMIESAGYASNLNTQSIETMIMVLQQIEQMDGVNEISLKVTFGQEITLHDAGVYLVAGITSDANYTTAFDGNFAVITPDGYRAELGWAVEDENGIITIEALRNGYDLSAVVKSVTEGTIQEATAQIQHYFVGVNKDGILIVTSNPEDLDIGAYTEFAFIMDLGNTMYYAEPIARAFVVAADIMNVEFIDKDGNANPDQIFNFGEDATMHAIATDRNGTIKNGTMTYLYAGVQTNGEFYRGTKAPTRPGAYTVIALFIGENEMNVGAGVGTLVIKPIPIDFQAQDTTVPYDGNEHTVISNSDIDKAYLVMDVHGNLNIILPPELCDGSFTTEVTINNLLTQLDQMYTEYVCILPEKAANAYIELITQIKTAINQAKDDCKIKSITINGAFPIEVGQYKFFIFGFKDTEHEVKTSQATLTILCAHKFDNAWDTECNLCGAVREAPDKPTESCEHEYDNNCDNTCNKCNEKREVSAHVYDNDCDADCNICGNTRTPADHVYDDEYDADCNICGHTRNMPQIPEEVPDSPPTGDNSMIHLWIILAIASASTIYVMAFKRRRV